MQLWNSSSASELRWQGAWSGNDHNYNQHQHLTYNCNCPRLNLQLRNSTYIWSTFDLDLYIWSAPFEIDPSMQISICPFTALHPEPNNSIEIANVCALVMACVVNASICRVSFNRRSLRVNLRLNLSINLITRSTGSEPVDPVYQR